MWTPALQDMLKLAVNGLFINSIGVAWWAPKKGKRAIYPVLKIKLDVKGL